MKLLFITLIGFLGFGNPNTDIIPKEINIAESTINWIGTKVTGSHSGTLAIKSGSLDFEGAVLTGGTFTIDMTSIACTDLEGGMADKLVGHLSSDDFFSIASFPEATITITKAMATPIANSYNITGDLTIKGITKPVSFDAILGENYAVAKISVNRTLYDIKYGSGSFFDNLGDKTIYDNFDVEVKLVY